MTAIGSELQVGLGYRRALHAEMLSLAPERLDFVEIAPENYCGIGGRLRRNLVAIRDRWPVLTHGLALSLGGEDPLDPSLVSALAEFLAEVRSPWHSDHVCWSSAGGQHLHDLLPMPMTRDTARRTAARIRTVAAELPVPLAIENVSAYARRPEDTMAEPDFVTELVEASGCKLLLDVNNIYVNAINFGADPFETLARMPLSEVVQIHVAGFDREAPDLAIDTHGQPVAEPVWPLLEEALRRTGPVPVLLERDFNFPPIEALLAEIDQIRAVGARLFGRRPAASAKEATS